MSTFVEVHPLGATEPMLLNLDEVLWIGKGKAGNAHIKYKDKEHGIQAVEEEYEILRCNMSNAGVRI